MTTSNIELWNLIRAKYPTFASHTSKGTAETFTTAGFEALKSNDPQALDDFFSLSVRVWCNFINEDTAKDDLEASGFGEKYNVPFGSIIQRMSTEPVLPVTPAFKGLKNGEGPDPFVVYKPTVKERFFKQNFDYQSLVTMPDDYTYKVIFTTDGGMATYLQSQIMRALEAGYTAQKYENKLQALNAYINSTVFPLQDTQKLNWTVATEGQETSAELAGLVTLVKDAVEAMGMGPYNSAFNSMKHSNVQDKGRLKLLIRPGYMNKISTILMANTFHDDRLNMPIDPVTVPNFGGLKATSDGTTELHPVYDALGHCIGYNTAENATEVTVEKDAVQWVDPNKNIIAMIADKGLLFEGIQNPYTVEPIRNPRGRYTNLWASSPNNTVAVDALYNAVIITENGQA